ncbi:hypothetical protein [Sphaerisporangium perillae]|uniref:hypothetical protein n=1 Tax=Sphaerisporangium perillae TaxID=2935860 RepID=UPI0020100CD6|nr:hypothetical protein [Sphaerisporangium perillae]
MTMPTMRNDDGIDVLEAVERETTGLFEQADRLVEALAARAGLDAARFRCLTLLSRQGPLPVRRLAWLAGLGDREVAEALDRMERDGHVIQRCEEEGRRVLVHAGVTAHRARVEPALRELREAWYPLVRHRCDDLALIAGFMARSRRLSDLVGTMRTLPDAFTL